MTPSLIVSHTRLHRNQGSDPGQFQESLLLFAAIHFLPFQHHGERPAEVCIGSQSVLKTAFPMEHTHTHCLRNCVCGLLVH